MGKIYIIGLGPGSISDMTLGCAECIKSGRRNYLRTENHPAVEYFKKENISYESYDDFYGENDKFNTLYENIAEDLIEKSKEYGEINYFVPGNAMVFERTVSILFERDVDCEIVSGLSFIEPLIESVQSDPADGLKILNAEELSYRELDINNNTILTQVYNKRILSETKITLSEVYGDEYEIYLIDAAGTENETVSKMKIFELDRGNEVGYLSSVFIPKMLKNSKKKFDIADVLCIIEVLRGIDGCPWDKKQTHKSLKKYLLEEAYELAYAIDEDDPDEILEELGDVLYQVAFHTIIAREEGEFLPIDVTTTLAEKLIYRHPHVFGDENKSSDELRGMWEKLKYEKRGLNSISERISDIKGLPALMTAGKMLEKIKAEGIAFEDFFHENYSGRKDEIYWGDLLIKLSYEAAQSGVDLESALQKAIKRIADKLRYQ